MENINKVHCLFEQSGTFKNEFIKLGIPAEDYDIQNHIIDIFSEIENAYDNKPSVFDTFKENDLILAFFPCIYFCSPSALAMRWDYTNYRALSLRERTDKILERAQNRLNFFSLAIKMLTIAKERNLKLIMENPWTSSYLTNNFVIPPTLIDNDRSIRGDYFKKPTAYWFINISPKSGFLTINKNYHTKTIKHTPKAPHAGICSEQRSLISPEYAKNFIRDFILGIPSRNTQLPLF